MKETKKPKGTFICAKEHISNGSDLIWDGNLWLCPEEGCNHSVRKVSAFSQSELQKIHSPIIT